MTKKLLKFLGVNSIRDEKKSLKRFGVNSIFDKEVCANRFYFLEIIDNHVKTRSDVVVYFNWGLSRYTRKVTPVEAKSLYVQYTLQEKDLIPFLDPVIIRNSAYLSKR